MEPKELFLRTLDDLEKQLGSNDPYEILGISALIRKLFLDDNPLVDQVNRESRIKVEFCIAVSNILNNPKIPTPDFYSEQDGLDPDTAPPMFARQTVNRDKFFKTIVMLSEGKSYTVRDTIAFEANVMGGVHAGSPKDEKDRALMTIAHTWSIGGYPASLRQLKGIGRVVLKALQPLRNTAK